MVTRSLANADNGELVSAIAAEVHEALSDHKAFVADQISQVIAELVGGTVEFIDKRADAVRTELLTEIERLRAETAQLRAEVARLSAADFDKSNQGVLNGCVIKH